MPSKFNIGGFPIKLPLLGLDVKLRGKACTEFAKIDPELYKAVRMRDAWNEIALHISWGSRDIFNSGQNDIFYGRDGADLSHDDHCGHSSNISFNRKYLKFINKLHSNGQAQSLKMLNVQFVLAITLCHEVAHAVGTYFSGVYSLVLGLFCSQVT